MRGSTTARVAATATAASKALPPLFSMSKPACAASGCVVTTMPLLDMTGSPSAGAPAETMVRFSTSLSDEALAPLLSHLVQEGEAVAQFREVATDLEDAFLSVASAGEHGTQVKASAPLPKTICVVRSLKRVISPRHWLFSDAGQTTSTRLMSASRDNSSDARE